MTLSAGTRIVPAVHGRRGVEADPEFEVGLTAWLTTTYGEDRLVELYGRFASGDGPDGRADASRNLARPGPALRGRSPDRQWGRLQSMPETFEIGRGVFIGAQSYIQGRYDGTCVIGDNVWIGPQAFLDARDLVMEDCVGWGPGAKILGSTHSAIPADVPIIRTDLEIKPVRIGAWADIGTNATILPGVTIGKGAIVGAGAVVTSDVEPFAVVAGVPAKFLHWRTDSDGIRNASQGQGDGNEE